VRRVIYTTNSIEALHRQLRKIIKTRGHFPTEDAARKLITSRSPKPRLDGSGCSTGQPRWQPSRSSSATAFLTLQSDCHYLTHRESLLLLHSQLTRKT